MKPSITTPTGKRISPRAYVARVSRLLDPPPCEHGHFGCAAWDDGPCTDELSCEHGCSTCGDIDCDGDCEG